MWRGYTDFKSYQKEDEMELSEFTKVRKTDSSLPVDIFVDDYFSYKRHDHPLWLYFRNGYNNENDYLPILINNSPIIPLKEYNLNISENDLSKIFTFIVTHLYSLINYANDKMDIDDFFEDLNPKHYSMAESKTPINEMATIKPKQSGLPCAIWVDESELYIKGGHGPRIKFQARKDNKDTHSWATMSLSKHPEIIHFPDNADISSQDIKMVTAFVIINYELLVRLIHGEIDYRTQFIPNIVKVDKHGNPILNGVI